MEGHVEGFRGPLEVSQFKGGQSNPTYRLDTPPAESSSCGASRRASCCRARMRSSANHRVICGAGHARLPGPARLRRVRGRSVIGTPFFVMDLVDGRIVWEAHFPGLSREDRAAHFDAMNATIAQLHGFDPSTIGLGDYGRAAGFVERQVARWSKQYLADTEAGRVPAMDRLVDWLGKHLPPDSGECGVVHGDFRCDNMIFAPTSPRVAAVLDWELSTLGDPAADFVYHLLMYRMPAGVLHRPGRPRPRRARHSLRGGLCRRLLPAHRPRSPSQRRLSGGVRACSGSPPSSRHQGPAGARQCVIGACRRRWSGNRAAGRAGAGAGALRAFESRLFIAS